jgi:hypothetical protein
MTDKNKKPNQVVEQKVDNSTLLPGVFTTVPNKKMLDSTLDLATSKGQLLPFNETYGLRNASDPDGTFLVNESNLNRAESQTNSTFVLHDDSKAYLSKSSYLDIANYFNIQGLPLNGPNRLDQDVLNLNLPINSLALTEYEQFYWLPDDLPIIVVGFDPDENGNPKFSIRDNIIGKPYARIIPDTINGEPNTERKSLELVSGLQLIFVGAVEEEFLTIPPDEAGNDPKVFYVRGYGTSISFQNIWSYDLRVVNSYYKKIPWDNTDVPIPNSLKFALEGWGGSNFVPSWDTSLLYTSDPEYVVADKFAPNNNPWSVINKWYHISTIRTVCEFLGLNLAEFTGQNNQAKRPIIQYYLGTELADWPRRSLADVQAFFEGRLEDFKDGVLLVDDLGYTLKEGDNVIFTDNASIYQAYNVEEGAKFNLVSTASESDGATFVFSEPNTNNFKRVLHRSEITDTLYEVQNYMRGDIGEYTGHNVSLTPDAYFKALNVGNLVVFEQTEGVYRVESLNPASFEKIAVSFEYQGVTLQDYRLIFKAGTWVHERIWRLAQNKTSKNQIPLFKFYTIDKLSISKVTDNQHIGGVILGFEEGSYYDAVLEKKINLSNIDFEIVDPTNPRLINGNQIKFTTHADYTFPYYSTDEGIDGIKGPFYYKLGNTFKKFWSKKPGLNLTLDREIFEYSSNTETNWGAEVSPVANGFDEIHLFSNSETGDLDFYFKLDGRGYVRFDSTSSGSSVQSYIPVPTGNEFKVVCHNLAYPITFYKYQINNNGSATELIPLSGTQCQNNSISNGTIIINLQESVLINGEYIDNDISVDLAKLAWSYNNSYRLAVARPLYKMRFLFNAYLQDKTYPIYHDYDYSVTDITNPDGSLAYKQQFNGTSLLTAKAQDGDKIIVEGIFDTTNQKTAPASLVYNPLNQDLSSINYYSLYQNFTSSQSSTVSLREIVDPTSYKKAVSSVAIGGGTYNKHNSPLSKLAVMTTDMPFDFCDLLTKQGKHYDSFYARFKTELTNLVKSKDTSSMTSLDAFNIALKQIYLNQEKTDSFWYHSNMIGWGNPVEDYTKVSETIDNSLIISISGALNPVSIEAGKETLIHILYNGKILRRGVDYGLTSQIDGYLTRIKFKSSFAGKTVDIYQWNNEFPSRIPASLAKIGLAPVYRPEIYKDTSYSSDTYFLYRHDGTRYYLENGVDANGYPYDKVDAFLYEYELAVWSSIAYNIEQNSFAEYLKNKPGGFREAQSYTEARSIVNADIVSWLSENNIFILKNQYDEFDPFTYRYSYGTGDSPERVEGSWRAIYKFFYDTDRPHTHPWEMLGYTVKPLWWDTYYSWTDPVKRTALEQALRLGNAAVPPAVVPNPYLARISNVDDPEEFPVDANGNLLPPTELAWLNLYLSTGDDTASWDWEPGDFSPYDLVFLSTQRGVAAEAKLTFLTSPTQFTTNNWMPGSVIVKDGLKLDKDTNYWITATINHDYHRKVVDSSVVYTAGIESLYSEFCKLLNIDFYTTVIQRFNNIEIKKEFLLGGFTNKNNVRIKSTSIATQTKNLFVPEENYQVRTIKHYPHKEVFYSGIRILWEGTSWVVYGFTSEEPYFNYYAPADITQTVAISIGKYVVKEKVKYDTSKVYKLRYGTTFTNRQDLYDFIIGYGKYLEKQGFKFEEPEAGDIRNWQLSGKQYIFWSNDILQPGNYIDLNPAADEIIFTNNNHGQLENIANGLCVDRFNKALFAKDLIVQRGHTISVKTKDNTRSIYGIKLTFVDYESVIHLDSTSIFNDVYFLPAQGTTKRSFSVGGKKSAGWNGEYFVYGYMFSNSEIIPNFETMADVGRTLYDIENVTNDNTLLQASRAQFGLSRNSELRSLFLTDETETLFKNTVSFEKGTNKVFSSLEKLTHRTDNSTTTANEDYMVRIGELGNTRNIEYYEFQLTSDEIKKDRQVINFDASGLNSDATYIRLDRWVSRPRRAVKDSSTGVTRWIEIVKDLRFDIDTNPDIRVKTSGPVATGDTDYAISGLKDVPYLYSEFNVLYNIGNYDNTRYYKKGDQFRYKGKLYFVNGTVNAFPDLTTAAAFALIADKIYQIGEPFLPNIFIDNYNNPNPDLTGSGNSIFTPGTWQVLQLFDTELAIEECCTGLTDVSLARISTNKAHNLKVGDQVLIINAESTNASVNGVWTVDSLDSTNDYQFYIKTRITETIYNGKVFTFRPVRFKDHNELALANRDNGYVWNKKINVPGQPDAVPEPTASGYPSQYPLAIVDNSIPSPESSKTTDGYGSFSVYSAKLDGSFDLLKSESSPVKVDNIEHLIVYDHDSGKTTAKLELFDPKKLKIPQSLLSEIDIINRVDPAKYNRTTDKFKAIYTSAGWYEEFVGRRWWNLSSIQFVDYDSGSEQFKVNNWGKTVGDKLPEIYEWTKSPVPPNQWAKLVEQKGDAFGEIATGEVFVDNYTGDDNFHWVEEQDYVSGRTYTVYYFWVKNKNSIPKESKFARTYAIKPLSQVLLNPDAAGIAWWAPITTSSIVVKGIKTYLNSSSTVVQIKKKLKGDEKHQQWMFISENNAIQVIPEWMHVRMRDSLAAELEVQYEAKFAEFDINASYKQGDIVKYNKQFWIATYQITAGSNDYPSDVFDENNATPGTTLPPQNWYIIDGDSCVQKDETTIYLFKSAPVPNLALHPYNRTGNLVRPYMQSWFRNLLEARRTFIKKANTLLKNIDVFNSIENWGYRLNSTSFVYGDINLDMTRLWKAVDYVSADFDTTIVPHIVPTDLSIYNNSSIAIGDYVQIANTGVVYEKVDTNDFAVVYRKNGTLEFISELYTVLDDDHWDTTPWDKLFFDYDVNAAFGTVVDALRHDIFINEWSVNYNKITCAMLRYVLSEQKYVDWVTKASTIEPVNLLGQDLTRVDELERDNISTVSNFYSSVKAYRDKIRNGDISKQANDPVNIGIEDPHVIKVVINYGDVSIGEDEVLPVVTGLEFPRGKGWGRLLEQDTDPHANNSIYSTADNIYDSEIQQVYNSVNNNSQQVNIVGTDKSRYYKVGRGADFADVKLTDSVIIDITQFRENGNDLKLRMYQYEGIAQLLILNNKTNIQLISSISDTANEIEFNDMSQLPDASADNVQFVWIDNEKIAYTIKTATSITGLIRGVHGTSKASHTAYAAQVYLQTSKTSLEPGTSLMDLHLAGPLLNDLGLTLDDSHNPMAKAAIYYIDR